MRFFGTSRALAVGPVAVVSLMTAASIGNLSLQGSADYAAAAITLAFLSGIILLVMGIFRLGFLANFLSHPVITGFITATGILIATSQLKHILGISASGHTLYELGSSLFSHLSETSLTTVLLGFGAALFLFWVRRGLKPLLLRSGLDDKSSEIITRAGPVIAVIATTLLVWGFDLHQKGVAIVGTVPLGLPSLTVPHFEADIWSSLFLSAVMISIIGFVESVSVAQTLAAKKRQRIVPNQELIGLGASNLAASFSGGYPVTGGFARSVVNFDAGAATPAAGAFTAIGIGIATLTLTPLLYFLPIATLAATIIVAVLSLVDFSILERTWNYSKTDFIAVSMTIIMTLGFGVEFGVSTGVAISILLHLYKTSRPHIAEVGLMPGSEHFRNIKRHEVLTDPRILTIRVDESLYFANARFLEDYLYDRVVSDTPLEHVILMCSAMNDIDSSALGSLEAINERLKDMKIDFHLSEVKSPVMDCLRQCTFLEHLTGQVFLSQYEAVCALGFRKG